MDDEILRLRRLLQEKQQKLEDEQRRRVEAEGRVLNEQRRREAAEEAAQPSQLQTLQPYLEACHSLNLAIPIVTDPSSTTQGDTTNPTGRRFTQRIVPWRDFAARQAGVCNRLAAGRSFSSRPLFPAPIQLKYVKSMLYPISSEIGFRIFEHETVENAVRTLFSEAYSDPELRSALDLQCTITFESHTNLGNNNETTSQSMERISISSDNTAVKPATKKKVAKRAYGKAIGKGNRADQFCIYKDEQGRRVPVIAIEYKPPHKLGRDEIMAGLQWEIQPERDVIHNDGKGYNLMLTRLAAAVVTQLFSYMIGKGVQYGYVCTGEVFIFLFIPDDPSVVYYHTSVPDLDVRDDDDNRLHRTAVAQVFAFILQAVVDDVLKDIEQTPEKNTRGNPPYKAQRWKGFERSPTRTRFSSGCKPPELNLQPKSDGNYDDYNNDHKSGPASPSPNQPPYPGKHTATSRTQTSRDRNQKQTGKQKIQDRPFCTQKCLLGLARGGLIDTACPNIADHKGQHIDQPEFIRLIRAQLATDRGRDADCAPLYLAGALGALFKLRLSSHGYTLVAKGMKDPDYSRLQHEHAIYKQLQPIQGEHLPVCLGMTDLVLPYYYDQGLYTNFLFLSFGGLPLVECINQIDKYDVLDAVRTAYMSMHQLRVLHSDAEIRNILYNVQTKKNHDRRF
ncbi:uncharacterized protein BCR38DRAFT_513253 [Pseudomassariella vexata]|uniref:Protein kinase domain-containing protein n=1 Tax=Pseudomassariella vexata TaxID=1141098 RepID=A0A1Y2E232_9PEZI|nr:uncharacterized protein BCR38DRAFT_513253 [Pseudomassariella vexata]ORY64925.1 hypothetical protein BCR38DRAFT_513253 [Pseudomassariella vexata]